MKIKKGHLIRVFDDGNTYEGIVVEIADYMDNEYLKYMSLKVYDALNKQVYQVCVGGSEYKNGGMDFSVMFIREVSANHLVTVTKKYKKYHEKKVIDISPNTDYHGDIEIYVKTKKRWFTLLRTTAKMAMFDGGRCIISNITDTRRKEK